MNREKRVENMERASLSLAWRSPRLSCEIFRVSTPPPARPSLKKSILSIWRCTPHSLFPSLRPSVVGGWSMESELWESDLSPSRSPSMFHWWRLQLRPGEEGEGKAEGRRRRSRVASMVLRIASKVRNIAPPLISRRTAPRLPSSSSFIYFELSNCKFLGGHGGRKEADGAGHIFRLIYAILERMPGILLSSNPMDGPFSRTGYPPITLPA